MIEQIIIGPDKPIFLSPTYLNIFDLNLASTFQKAVIRQE